MPLRHRTAAGPGRRPDRPARPRPGAAIDRPGAPGGRRHPGRAPAASPSRLLHTCGRSGRPRGRPCRRRPATDRRRCWSAPWGARSGDRRWPTRWPSSAGAASIRPSDASRSQPRPAGLAGDAEGLRAALAAPFAGARAGDAALPGARLALLWRTHGVPAEVIDLEGWLLAGGATNSANDPPFTTLPAPVPMAAADWLDWLGRWRALAPAAWQPPPIESRGCAPNRSSPSTRRPRARPGGDGSAWPARPAPAPWRSPRRTGQSWLRSGGESAHRPSGRPLAVPSPSAGRPRIP